jgi:hypothetical protein
MADREPIGRVADLAGEYGPLSALAVGSGAVAQDGLHQLRRAYLLARLNLARRWQGEEAAQVYRGRVADLMSEATENSRLYAPLRQASPYATAIGEAIPSFVAGRGAGVSALQFNAGRAVIDDVAPPTVRQWFSSLRKY